MKFKILDFKIGTDLNADNQLTEAELKLELKSKKEKWNQASKDIEVAISLR